MADFFTFKNIAIICAIAFMAGMIIYIHFSKNENSLGCLLSFIICALSIITIIFSRLFFEDISLHYDITINGCTYHCVNYTIKSDIFILELSDGTILEYYNPTNVAIEGVNDCECIGQ